MIITHTPALLTVMVMVTTDPTFIQQEIIQAVGTRRAITTLIIGQVIITTKVGIGSY